MRKDPLPLSAANWLDASAQAMRKMSKKREKRPSFYTQTIIQFFRERPSLSVSTFERECGLPDRIFNKILRGEKPFPAKHWPKVLPWMEKYGYVPTETKHENY